MTCPVVAEVHLTCGVASEITAKVVEVAFS